MVVRVHAVQLLPHKSRTRDRKESSLQQNLHINQLVHNLKNAMMHKVKLVTKKASTDGPLVCSTQCIRHVLSAKKIKWEGGGRGKWEGGERGCS
jgi:hypothetical protein